MGGTTESLSSYWGGAIRKILTVQAFDQYAILSLLNDVNHIEIGRLLRQPPKRARGKHPGRGGAGRTEIDVHFNVNVKTHSDGLLQYPTAAIRFGGGAMLTIIHPPLVRGRIPGRGRRGGGLHPGNRWTSW
jgi:citrate lyase alpha subunit